MRVLIRRRQKHGRRPQLVAARPIAGRASRRCRRTPCRSPFPSILAQDEEFNVDDSEEGMCVRGNCWMSAFFSAVD